MRRGISASFSWEIRDSKKNKLTKVETTKQGKEKKKKSNTARNQREEEKLTQQAELRLLQVAPPSTEDDYEKLIFANPNSSFLWIKYMAFWISLTDIDKARTVAHRALEKLNIRETEEKKNIWLALLNLENTYGTQESLYNVYQKAVIANDPKTIHIALIEIYQRSQKFEEATMVFKTLTRKFNRSKKVWLLWCLFLFTTDKSQEARFQFSRALKCLPKTKQFDLIFKFAQLEFKHGDPERARTIFENLLTTKPKRLDVWSVYIDMETKQEAFSKARNIFERVLTLNFSTKKMKFMFKKYLRFEQKHGEPKDVERVTQKAQEYIQQKLENQNK